MTQATKIFSFLLKNPLTRPIEISRKLKIPSASVRRALFNLRVKNIVSKPRKDFTASIKLHTLETEEFKETHDLEKEEKAKPKQASKLFWRKIVKSGKSGKNHPTDLVASTWEHFEGGFESRFTELKEKMRKWAELEKLQIGDLGYSKTGLKKEPTDIPEFPKIEVHTE